MNYTIVGVIGHIDHGKTSLVAALTGVDTDTHPEEKRRGITIDLGFASYTDGDHQFALIDAPGHQKYIGNLLAGVSAVDLGLLVVAVDQGIQAQTLEHAAILQSLGVSKLVVVMSRIDLADQAMRDELSEELDLFLAEFGFHDIPKIPVSVVTGEGLDALRDKLRHLARTTERTQSGPFRMPVDRVFTIEGRGCVIAGTPWSGSVKLGDQVELVRTGQTARVRELEVHGLDVTESRVGMRTAINLAGISSSDFERGDELVTPGALHGDARFLIELTMFADAAELRCPTTVQLHTAATSCEATIRGPKKVKSGSPAVVVVDTDSPVVATHGQSCLFRKPYPVGSFAGGSVLAVLQPGDRKMTQLLELGRELTSDDAAQRLSAWVAFRGEVSVDPAWCQRQLGISDEELGPAVEACKSADNITVMGENYLVSTAWIERASKFVVKLLTAQMDSGDDAWMAEDAVSKRVALSASATVAAHVIEQLVREKKLVRFNSLLALASESTTLSKKQRATMDQILGLYRDNPTPPTLKEVAAATGSTIDAVKSLVRFSTQQRVLLDLGGDFFIDAKAFATLCRQLDDLLQAGPQPVAAIRDHWGVTRKHAIPLLEYCDRIAATVRDGDTRVAGEALESLAKRNPTEEHVVEQD